MDDSRSVPWSEGRWTHQPVSAGTVDEDFQVVCAPESDAWVRTSYGFVHDSEHALVVPFPVGAAVEVVFSADFTEQFDQAGAFVVAAPELWVKAGVEFADGAPQVGAVVTGPVSDWSVAAVPEWAGRRVRVRVSRAEDSLTIRAGLDGEPLRLVRLAPFPGDAEAEAGPFACAPTRSGLTVRFHSWTMGPADAALH